LPDNLVISDVLTEDEIPKVHMKIIQVKLPNKADVGPAFHEKSAKNKKVNFIVKKKDRMMKKYGKPKTRGQKK
jgi:ATP-dependent RNA helicase RhlE